MTKRELSKRALEAAASGSLLTPKHDPANIHIAMNSFRSVLTFEASSSLCEMFANDAYSAEQYMNSNFAKTCYLLTPHDATFSPTALGLPSGSLTSSMACDSYLLVDGSIQGLHIFGESRAYVDSQIASGSLILIGKLV